MPTQSGKDSDQTQISACKMRLCSLYYTTLYNAMKVQNKYRSFVL